MAGGGGICGRGGACMAGETATAADGTHLTGMHSCYQLFAKVNSKKQEQCGMKIFYIREWMLDVNVTKQCFFPFDRITLAF